MKKDLTATIACFILIAYSCHKTGADVPPPAEYNGTWQYIGYSGGEAGHLFTPDVKENYLQVDGAGHRILYNNGYDLQGCGTFSYQQTDYGALFTVKGDESDFFANSTCLARLQNDTLVLYPGNCLDCFSTYYVPVNKQFTWCIGSGAVH